MGEFTRPIEDQLKTARERADRANARVAELETKLEGRTSIAQDVVLHEAVAEYFRSISLDRNGAAIHRTAIRSMMVRLGLYDQFIQLVRAEKHKAADAIPLHFRAIVDAAMDKAVGDLADDLIARIKELPKGVIDADR